MSDGGGGTARWPERIRFVADELRPPNRSSVFEGSPVVARVGAAPEALAMGTGEDEAEEGPFGEDLAELVGDDVAAVGGGRTMVGIGAEDAEGRLGSW